MLRWGGHEQAPAKAPALGTSKYRALLDELQREHGFERAALNRLFPQARLWPEIVGLFDRPPEQLPPEQCDWGSEQRLLADWNRAGSTSRAGGNGRLRPLMTALGRRSMTWAETA